MVRQLDYPGHMRRAMHGLIREVLTEVAHDGLPGDHHFYITFSTMHPDAEISDGLSDRYPEEMTIVLQHEWRDLRVNEEGFSVTLSFANVPEALFVPYDAIRTFVDPSESFGLQLEAQGVHASEPKDERVRPAPDEDRGEAEVVSLDKFRK